MSGDEDRSRGRTGSGERPSGLPPGLPRWAWAAAAVVLYLLLVDIAVETLLSGSPLGWWVAGAVAAYAGLTALLWRRVGWPQRAAGSLFVLLALLALTAWHPLGFDAGLTALRQPSSVLFSAATLAALLLAAAGLVRSGSVPPKGAWAVAVLTLYGVAAFALGAVEGVSYPELLRGGAFWTRLPFWLQGAFLGGVVLLPLLLLREIVRGALRVRGAALGPWSTQVAGLGLVVGIAVAGVTHPLARGGEAPAADASEAASAVESRVPSSEVMPAVAGRLRAALPALEAELASAPPRAFEVDAVVQEVGPEPTDLFAWVRDQTALVPYEGLLRGEEGVLMDRLGNSLDRAVLLYGLLRNAGHDVRLARATLPPADAERILERVRPHVAVDTGGDRGPDASVAPAFLRPSLELRRSLAEEAARRTRMQAAALGEAVGRHRVRDPDAADRAVAAVRDHWWVEWNEGASWVALDPTLPDAEPGMALAEVQETRQPARLTDLGSERLHVLEVRVVIETWRDGRLTETPVLTQELLPAALVGQRVVLRTLPVAWPQDLDAFDGPDVFASFDSAVTAQREWLPVLQVGERRIQRYSFDEYGDLHDSALPGWAQAALSGRVLTHKVGEGVGALGGSIGSMLGGGDEVAARPARPWVTALWIDYGIRSPGRADLAVRRPIFDLLGPAARSAGTVAPPAMEPRQVLERGLALLGETEILPQVAHLAPERVQQAVAAGLLAQREALRAALDPDAAPGAAAELARTVAPLAGLSTHLQALALVRSEWSPVRGKVYLDRPNVLTYRTGFQRLGAGHVTGLRAFDIVSNDVAIHTHAAGDPFTTRLEQGVLDTNLEALLLRHLGPVENTGELFAAADRDPWMGVASDDRASLAEAALPGDLRARVERDLAEGQVAVVPRRPVTLGGRPQTAWWRIDPRTGTTLGMGERGWGQSATETSLTTAYLQSAVILVGFASASLALYDCSQEADATGDENLRASCGFKFLCDLMSPGLPGEFHRPPGAEEDGQAGWAVFMAMCSCTAGLLQGDTEDCLGAAADPGPGPVALHTRRPSILPS